MKGGTVVCVDMNVCMHEEDGLIRETAPGPLNPSSSSSSSSLPSLPKRSHFAKGLNTFSALDMPQSDKCNDRFFFFFRFFYLFYFSQTKKIRERWLKDVQGSSGLISLYVLLIVPLLNTSPMESSTYFITLIHSGL